MAFDTLLSMSANVYFDSAFDFYKFLFSVVSGFLIFGLIWFLSTEMNYIQFFMTWISSICVLICLLYSKIAEKSVEGDAQENPGFGSRKRRTRRDDESSTKSTKTGGTSKRNSLSAKESPIALEPPRKNCRRQKKKRNSLKSNKSKYKGAMDDSSETSSNNDSYPKIITQVEKTKVYTPLPMYLKMNLELYDLYYEFKPYLLTPEQLHMYGFPLESSEHPGRITPDPKLKKGSTQRRCCRCGKSFSIQADGQYRADSSCRYHAKKQLPYRKDHPYNGDYPCCQGNYMSEGCVTWQFHVSAESFLHDVDFVKARNKRHLNEVTACTIYALDCEMLYTTAGIEVAKVGIVGVDGLTVFESFVLPQNEVLDYNTHFSGVSEKDLKGVTMTLVDVQAFLLKLLNRDTILVGHGLENDLKALRLIHEKVVDTSVVFPLGHSKFHKKSLKVLAKEFLNKHIQQSINGHDCIEDARTCMELMLLKISTDLKKRLPLAHKENQIRVPPPAVVPQTPTPVQYPCNYISYYSDFCGDNIYSGFCMPKKYYQKSCIY